MIDRVAVLAIVSMIAAASSWALDDPQTTEAKGPPDIMYGGGDLGPYYFTSGTSPPNGLLFPRWPEEDPTLIVEAPADSDTLLARAYTITMSWESLLRGQGLDAWYVPPSAANPAYLVWSGTSEWSAAAEQTWLVLPREEADYAEDLMAEARRKRDGGYLDTDPLQAFVRQGSSFDWMYAQDYVLGQTSLAYTPADYGQLPWKHLDDDEAQQLIEGYFSSLRIENWRPGPEPSAESSAYGIYNVYGHEQFAYQPAEGETPGRISLGWWNGYFVADPSLAEAIAAVDRRRTPESATNVASWQSFHRLNEDFPTVLEIATHHDDGGVLEAMLKHSSAFAWLREGDLQIRGSHAAIVLSAGQEERLREAFFSSLHKWNFTGAPAEDEEGLIRVLAANGKEIFAFEKRAQVHVLDRIHVPGVAGYFQANRYLTQLFGDPAPYVAGRDVRRDDARPVMAQSADDSDSSSLLLPALGAAGALALVALGAYRVVARADVE